MSIPAVGLQLALAKIERRKKLSTEARDALLSLPFKRKFTDRNGDLINPGDTPKECIILEKGILSRSKLVPDGGRQIMSFHIPGDLVDLQSLLLKVADHRVSASAAATTIHIPQDRIWALIEQSSEIARALWFDNLVDAAIYREWTLNLGRQNGAKRVAHLLLEIGFRMELSGLAPREEYVIPVTQVDLADATGLTQVHMSRTMSALRARGLILWNAGTVKIPDWNAACEFAHFDRSYLHIEGPRTPLT